MLPPGFILHPFKGYRIWLIAGMLLMGSACDGHHTPSTTRSLYPPPPQEQKKDTSIVQQINYSHKFKIYLSFDDGPGRGTRQVLSIIREEKVPASMFLIAKDFLGSPENHWLVEAEKKCPYLELGNHSFTHGHNKFKLFYSHPQKVLADFQRCQDTMHFSTHYVRFPGRNVWRVDTLDHTDNPDTKASVLLVHGHGWNIMGWDLEWHYNYHTVQPVESVDTMVKMVKERLQNHETRFPGNLVFLSHDRMYADPADSAKLVELINRLKKNPNYEFVFLSHYPEPLGPADSARLSLDDKN
ncbi:MAG: polysaccharide deacetylase family protein [Chitinophagaceae bacterium]